METNNYLKDENSPSRQGRRNFNIIRLLLEWYLFLQDCSCNEKYAIFPDSLIILFSAGKCFFCYRPCYDIGSNRKNRRNNCYAGGGFFMIPMLFRETFGIYNISGLLFSLLSRNLHSKQEKGMNVVSSKDMIGDDYIDYVMSSAE